MSPTPIAATYGMPPKMYGFHSGMPSPCLSDCAAKSRTGKPPMYWSLIDETRKPPVSAGYPSTRVSSTYTSTAHASAKRGASDSAEVETEGLMGCGETYYREGARSVRGASEEVGILA